MKSWQLLLFGIFLGLLSTGVIMLVALPVRGSSIELLPAPTASPIKVYVTGAVLNPGTFNLAPQSRVEDAIKMAGGTLPEANLNTINLAARLLDEQKILVPTLVIRATSQPGSRSKNVDPQTTTPENDFPININTASVEELDKLPGIGAQKAASIITYRQSHGIFVDIAEIKNVPGIGDGLFDKISPYITVTP